MAQLTLSTLQAQNSEGACRIIAQVIAEKLALTVRFVDDMGWQERQQRLSNGQIDACWVCGLPYVQWTELNTPQIELLAAPVARGARYNGQPIYYSDVIVRADSPYETFEQLRGKVWAINEPNSQSGHGIVKAHLVRLGELKGFFGQVVESGAHQRSLRMIIEGEIDASAIDSTVLEIELVRDPQLAAQIKIIETMGPSPQPPWVVQRALDGEVRRALRDALLTLHEDPRGRAALAAGLFERFVAVTDTDYDPIRQMIREADGVVLNREQ